MSYIRLVNVTKQFGDVTAVNNLNPYISIFNYLVYYDFLIFSGIINRISN